MLDSTHPAPPSTNPPPQSRCFAHCHLSASEYGFYDVCRSLSHKTGVLYFDGRDIAGRFGSMAPSTAYNLAARLVKKGWLVLTKDSQRLSSGRFSARHYRVLSHEEWAAEHPRRCRPPVQDSALDAPEPVQISNQPVQISNSPVQNSVHNLAIQPSKDKPLEDTGNHSRNQYRCNEFIERYSPGGRKRARQRAAQAPSQDTRPVLNSGQAVLDTPSELCLALGQDVHDSWRVCRAVVERLHKRGIERDAILDTAKFYRTKHGDEFARRNAATVFEFDFGNLEAEMTAKMIAELKANTAPENRSHETA